MRKYKDQDIIKAKELRKRGRYSFAHLQRLTGIPATTIRNWCGDDYMGTRWDTLLVTNERKRQELKSSEVGVIDSIENINPVNAKVFASLIYWCEGSKYPATNKLDFVNSDPTLVKLYVALLRKAFIIDESKWRIHLQIHDIHNFEEVKSYWSNLLNIPKSQFIKPTITKANGGKHRREYWGTCAVRYYDFRIQLKLIGIYEAFVRRFGEVA